RGTTLPERGPGGNGGHQRAHTRAYGLLLVWRLEELALRRLSRARPRRRPLLHPGQGGDEPLARPPAPGGQSGISPEQVATNRLRSGTIGLACSGLGALSRG